MNNVLRTVSQEVRKLGNIRRGAICCLLIVCIAIVSYRVSYGLFSDAAATTNNTFAAAQEFPTGTPSATPTLTTTPTVTVIPTETITPTADVVINEVFAIGGNDDDWIELHNKTGSPLDVSGWRVRDNGASDEILPSVSPIPANGYAVIIASNSAVVGIDPGAVTIQISSTAIGNGLAQNGDRVILKDPTTAVIDQMSYGGDTTIFNSPPATPSASQSVRREPNGFDTNSASDWVIDSSPTIGSANN